MKPQIIHLILLASLLFGCTPKENQIVFDKEADQKILYGSATRAIFKNHLFNQWFTSEYDNYNVDSTSLDYLKLYANGITVKMVIGTWCRDTKREVPRFLKILDYLEIPMEKVDIIGVNRSKLCPEAGIKEGYVDYVPTFFIKQGGETIGSIVEKPKTSLELDFLRIVENK